MLYLPGNFIGYVQLCPLMTDTVAIFQFNQPIQLAIAIECLLELCSISYSKCLCLYSACVSTHVKWGYKLIISWRTAEANSVSCIATVQIQHTITLISEYQLIATSSCSYTVHGACMPAQNGQLWQWKLLVSGLYSSIMMTIITSAARGM